MTDRPAHGASEGSPTLRSAAPDMVGREASEIDGAGGEASGPDVVRREMAGREMAGHVLAGREMVGRERGGGETPGGEVAGHVPAGGDPLRAGAATRAALGAHAFAGDGVTPEGLPHEGLPRRAFLKLGLIAPAALVTASGCRSNAIQSRLMQVARVNDWLGERLLDPHRLAPTYPVSERTHDFPPYSISHPAPVLEHPEDWALEVSGLVRKPMRLTRAMLEALPRATYTLKHHCVEGWTAVGTWTGVPVSTVVALVEPTPEARYLRFDSFDRGYYNGWDLKSALHPQTLLAYAFNDRPLGADHGAPLRLYAPTKLGYKMTKYLTRMTFTAARPGGYWEDRGYPWFGGI